MIAHLYKITNNLTNQYYIGKRRGNEQGRYWGSGLRIKRHIKKYGKENFTYDVLRIDNEDKIFRLERRLITENYINTHKDCLNLAPGGLGGSGLMNKDYMRGDKNPSKRPEVRAKLSKLMNENHPLVIMSKTNNPNKGKKQPEELKIKVSETLKQRYRDGLQVWSKGIKMTNEQKKNMFGPRPSIIGKNNHFFGKNHTQKTLNILRDKSSKVFGFISPGNKLFKGKDLKSFCNNMKLSYYCMYNVLKGRQKTHNGWRVA